MAKRISVINFKGGVGKTTLAFHLATGLARYHGSQKVLLIDMDHQSSLSIVCLGAGRWEKAVQDKKTIDEVFRSFIGQNPAFPDESIIIQNPMESKPASRNHYRSMDMVPASLQLDDIEIDLTATHQGNAIHSEWNKRTLVCRWIEETRLDKLYDYIIFDCPPATKIVSQNAIAASHGYIIPVVPEAVMERGAPHLFEMMKKGIDGRLKTLAKWGDRRRAHVRNTKGCVSKVVEIGFGASPSGLSFAAVRPRGQGFRRRLADRGFPIHRLCASGFGRKRGAPRGASALFRDTAARSVF